jgi:outer membrane lipoprotein
MPSEKRSQSEGRFIAVRSGQFLDPAIIEPDAPLTVVGEVKGAVTKPLDEHAYQYPVLEIINQLERIAKPGANSGI